MILCANDAWYSLCTNTVYYIVIIVKYIGFEFEKKKHFIFPTMKGSMNACMEFLGFSTSNKVKNH